MEKPFDWKRGGTYAWKAAFPLVRAPRRVVSEPLAPPKPATPAGEPQKP